MSKKSRRAVPAGPGEPSELHSQIDLKTGKSTRGRPFAKGTSGNPAGRPRGSRNRVDTALREMVLAALPGLIRIVLKRARSGDLLAIRLLLRCLPAAPLEPEPVKFELPETRSLFGIIRAMDRVLQLTADGQLSIEQGSALHRMLDQQRQVHFEQRQ